MTSCRDRGTAIEEGQYRQTSGRTGKIGETVWYVATWRGQWVEPVGVGAEVRGSGSDRLGQPLASAETDRQQQPPSGWNRSNVGSRVLSGTERRDGSVMGCCCWLFVDPRRFHGGVYGWNWDGPGDTGAPGTATAPKPIRSLSFVRPLCRRCAQAMSLPLSSSPEPPRHAQCRTDAPTPSASRPFPIAIPCRQCWASPRARRCAACTAIKSRMRVKLRTFLPAGERSRYVERVCDSGLRTALDRALDAWKSGVGRPGRCALARR